MRGIFLRKWFFWGGIGVVVAILLYVLVASIFFQPSVSYPEGVYIGEQLYSLEYALTVDEQSLGLGQRDSLCETCAMSFPFQIPGKYTFWMKDMRFPIDIAWISLDGQVVHIERSISSESKELYRSKELASMVLEFNSGALDTLSVGDKIHFYSPQPKLFP